jgi:hypothetical protein
LTCVVVHSDARVQVRGACQLAEVIECHSSTNHRKRLTRDASRSPQYSTIFPSSIR